MSRRRKPSTTSASPTPPTPVMPLALLVQRVLLGSLTALLVARPLVAGHDPGRLVLTTSGAELTYNLGVFLLFLVTAIHRAVTARRTLVAFEALPLMLLLVGGLNYISSLLGDRYARPGLYHAWEWAALAALFYSTRRIPNAFRETRGLLNAVLASAVSVAALGVYQVLQEPLALPSVALPTARPDLAGHDEFFPELNQPAYPVGPKGTFEQPATLAVFTLLFLPLGMVVARAGWASTLRLKFLLVVPILLGTAFIVSVVRAPSDLSIFSEAFALLKNHLLLGIGPGNFSRLSHDHTHSVGSAWLLLLVTTGVLVVPLLLGIVILAVRILRRPSLTDDVPMGDVRWEFYGGGIAGLTLGFIWSLGSLPAEATADETIRLGMVAVGRAIVWFVVFGTLERLQLGTPTLARALLVGVVLVGLAGFLHDVVLLPTILAPLVVMLALLCNTRPTGNPVPLAWSTPLATALTGNAAVLLVLFLVTAALPGWGTTNAVREARRGSLFFADQERNVYLASNRVEQANARTAARNYLRNAITNPLREAVRQDAHNAALLLEIARWQRPLYRYQTHLDPKNAVDVARNNLSLGELATKLDPHNLAGQRSLYESLLTFLQETGAIIKPKERTAVLNERIRLLTAAHPTDEVPLRYRMVQALLDGGEAADAASELARLWRLAHVDGAPHGSLTPDQRRVLCMRGTRLIKWHQLPGDLLRVWLDG